MADAQGLPIREQLADRRSKLESSLATSPKDHQLLRLLNEVDAALYRLDDGTYSHEEVVDEIIESIQGEKK